MEFDTIVLPKDNCLQCLEYYWQENQDLKQGFTTKASIPSDAKGLIQGSVKATKINIPVFSEPLIPQPVPTMVGDMASKN